MWSWNEYCIDDEHKLYVCFPEKPTSRIKDDYPYCKLIHAMGLIYIFIGCCHSLPIIIMQKYYFNYLVMLASVPFLIITFCVYGAIRELRNLHGKCLMCYVSSLTLLYISIATIQIWHTELSEDHKTVCTILGYTSFTSILMCFFWLNTMCYDIWSTFRCELGFFN